MMTPIQKINTVLNSTCLLLPESFLDYVLKIHIVKKTVANANGAEALNINFHHFIKLFLEALAIFTVIHKIISLFYQSSQLYYFYFLFSSSQN